MPGVRAWPFLLAGLLTAQVFAGADPLPSDDARSLVGGPPDQWPAAVRRLSEGRGGVPALAVSAVLSRIDTLDPDLRRQAADALYPRACWPPVRRAMASLMRDGDAAVGEAALRTFLHCDGADMPAAIAAEIGAGHPLRGQLVEALGKHWARLQERRLGIARYRPWHAGRETTAGTRETHILPVLLPLLGDPDARVREQAVQAVALFADPRVDDALYPLTGDAEPAVREAALWSLARHHDPRVFDTLLAWAREEPREWHRNRRFESLGGAYSPTRLLDFLDLYRHATDPQQRHDYGYLVNGALYSEMVEDAPLMAALQVLVDDPEPFIRDTAGKVLGWKARREREQLAAEVRSRLPLATLLFWLGAALLLGTAMVAWTFRLLGLRYLVHSTPYAKIRSLAVGMSLVRARVAANATRLVHPMSGESCAFYGGADRHHPGLVLEIEDDTGAIGLEARGAILLSREGLLQVGDPVVVLAQAEPGTGERRRVLRKGGVHRSWPERLLHVLVHRLMGAGARGGTARMLFSDPRSICLLWDESRRPFSSTRELAPLLAAVGASGFWIILFAISAWQVAERLGT